MLRRALTQKQKSNANKYLKGLSNKQVEEFMIKGPNGSFIGKHKITDDMITNAERKRILRLMRPFTRNSQLQVTQYITRLNPENFKKLGITKFGENFTADNIAALHAYPNYFLGGGKARNTGYVQPGALLPFTKHLPFVNKVMWNYKLSNEKKRLLREELNSMGLMTVIRRAPASAYRSATATGLREAKKYAKKKAISYIPSVAKETAKTVLGLAATAMVTKAVVNTGTRVIKPRTKNKSTKNSRSRRSSNK